MNGHAASSALTLPNSSIPIPGPHVQWQPSADGLKQVVSLFTDPNASTTPNINEYYQQQYQQLQLLSQHPEFNNYLVYLLSVLHDQPDTVRTRAGLQLKNNVKESYVKMHPTVQQYVKQQVLLAIGDSSHYLRTIVGTVIASIATQESVQNWPGLFQFFVMILDHHQQYPTYAEAVLNAISKIAEDMHDLLYSEDPLVLRNAIEPMNILLPKIIQFLLHSNDKLRVYALTTINIYLPDLPEGLLSHIDTFMASLFKLASDNNSSIQKRVCQAFVILVEVRYDLLHPQIDNVIKFMIHSSKHADESVSLEATEFWSVYMDAPGTDPQSLKDNLHILVPVLLDNMIYSEDDPMLLDADDDGGDSSDGQLDQTPDRAEDIKPHHHRSTRGADEEEAGDDDFDASQWNLRKCSAAALDNLAHTYVNDIPQILLPQLQQLLTTQTDRSASSKEDAPIAAWKLRESGVLALGAVAEGCLPVMVEYLPQLIPYLLELLKDSKPLIRSITCWTLSRYSSWIVENAEHDKYFKPFMISLLQRVLDRHKKVQEAACSAFATFEEEAGDKLVPYLRGILQTLMYAFSRYQARNLLLLYDAIGTLAEAVGHELAQPEIVQILMPPLITKWNALDDNDRNIFPLLECLTSIAQALGQGFQPFASVVFERCLKIITTTLIATQHAMQQPNQEDVEYPDTEFVVCALDLLSGLSEGLGPYFGELASQHAQLSPVLFECVKSDDPDTRQSGFALLGDIAKTSIDSITPHLDKFFPIAAQNLNPQYVSVCNNACWSIGELAIQIGPAALREHIPNLLQYLTALITSAEVGTALLENAAITLGRLGLVCTAEVGQSFNLISVPLVRNLIYTRVALERYQAYQGLIRLILQSPQTLLQPNQKHSTALPYLLATFHSYHPAPEDIVQQFRQVAQQYKQSIGQQRWHEVLQQTKPEVQQYVVQVLGIQ